MRNDIRHCLSNQISIYTYQDYEEKNIADYIAWFSTNIDQISALGFSSFYSICTTIFQTIIAVISLGMIYRKMSLFSLVFIAILYLISLQTKKYIIQKSKGKVTANEIFFQKSKDLLQGFPVLYCYKKMHLFTVKMEDASIKYEEKNYDNTVAQIRVNALLLSVNIIFQSAFIIIAVWCVFHNLMRASSIIGIYSFLPKVFDGITDTIQLKNAIIATKPYFEQMEQNINADDHDIIKPIKAIELHNLSYSYGSKLVLSDVSYRFERGKKYAIVGKSGCGKSTLLKIIAGLFSDYQGNIMVNGKIIRKHESILSQVAYIDQQPQLFDGTVLENICLWDKPDNRLLKSVLQKSGLNNIQNIFEYGLNTLITEGGKNLSGGQKQRVAIARALYDEGTSALDKFTRESVEHTLLSLSNLTIIMISHHLTQTEQEKLDGTLRL